MDKENYFSYRGFTGVFDSYSEEPIGLSNMICENPDIYTLSRYGNNKDCAPLEMIKTHQFYSSIPLFDYINEYKQEELESDMATLSGNEFLIDTTLSMYSHRRKSINMGLSEKIGDYIIGKHMTLKVDSLSKFKKYRYYEGGAK